MHKDLIRRAGLVLDAVVLCALGVPWWLATPAALLAVVAVSERVARHRRRGGMDALIIGIVGPLVALLFLGLVLNLLPGGITRVSWSIGAGIVGLAALACCLGRPVPPPVVPRGMPVPRGTLLWGSAAAVIALGALAVSVNSSRSLDGAPVQLSQTTVDGVTRVLVTAGSDAGPFVLRSDNAGSQSVVRRQFSMKAGQTVSVPVLVPDGARVTVTLTNPSQTQAVRSVVLDRSTS